MLWRFPASPPRISPTLSSRIPRSSMEPRRQANLLKSEAGTEELKDDSLVECTTVGEPKWEYLQPPDRRSSYSGYTSRNEISVATKWIVIPLCALINRGKLLVFQILALHLHPRSRLEARFQWVSDIGVRYVGVMRFVFRLLQLRLKRFKHQNLCCTSKSTIKVSTFPWNVYIQFENQISPNILMIIRSASFLIPWLKTWVLAIILSIS